MYIIFSNISQSGLTQEDKDAGQDGDECSSAQAHWLNVGIWIAGHDIALVVTAAHLNGQCAGAGLDRLLAVRDKDRQVEDGLVLL